MWGSKWLIIYRFNFGRKKLKSESLVWQTDENDCGVACAASLLALHGVEVDYHSFRETFHIGSSGISFQQIHDRLTAYGAAPETYQVEDSEDIDDSMLPCIASFERHFVLILGVRRGRIKIFDPTFGKLELPHRKFQERYTGYVMKIAGFPELKSEKLQNPTIERNAGLEHELFRKNALLIGGGAILISSVNLSVPYLVDQILS
jgi:ATP-binding cassette subfamily B protein RaxB